MSSEDKPNKDPEALESPAEVVEESPVEPTADAVVDEAAPIEEAGIVSETTQPDTQNSNSRPSNTWGVAALIIAVIALLLAAGVAGLGHYRAQQLDQQIAALPPAIERNAGRITGAEQNTGQLAQALQQQKAVAESQDRALEEALGALRKQLGRDQSGWVLAEAEYLLLVANHRLQLERDVTTALAALTLADGRLRETGDPALIGIREKIANETAALKTLSRPDITGLALSLMGLADQVDRLPLQNTYLPVAASREALEAGARQVEDWRQLAGAVWGDLKGLVTVRHREETVRPMLAPEHQYFLRQNLRLQLESARLALLRADQQQLNEALQTARDWIPKYFDERAAPTQGMLGELERIGGIEIRPALPDVSGSLKALRAHMREAAKQE